MRRASRTNGTWRSGGACLRRSTANAAFVQPVAVQSPLRLLRLHEALKRLPLRLIERFHLPLNPPADQIAQGRRLRIDLERPGGDSLAGGGFVEDRDGQWHGPESAL